MITDPIRETVRQAAREAVAVTKEAAGRWNDAALIRLGHWDNLTEVRDALFGADAALTASAPLIRAQALRDAAAVAQAEESHLRAESFRAKEQPDVFPGLARERELQAVTAMEIMLAILALNETEVT